MKFVCSTVPNCRDEEEGNVTRPAKGREEEEHAKVYPFTVSLPRYASWRIFVRILLSQLKSCSNCKAAADAFPVSTLPKVHTLPNGKVLIFKGLTNSAREHKQGFSRRNDGAGDRSSEEMYRSPLMDASDEPTAHHHQSLSTFHEPSIAEYDMVSINPNCPKHGRYSLTAWLQKEGAKVVGVKGRAICKIYPKTKSNQNDHMKQIKLVKKRDGIGRSISSNFSKHILDEDVIEKPSRMEVSSTLKKHKNENLEFNVLKQIEIHTTTNPSILFKKQSNILSTYNHQNNSVLQSKQNSNSKTQKVHLNRKKQFNSEQVRLESNDNKIMSVKITSKEREKCETFFRKDLLPISNKDLDKDSCKCPKTYALQYKKMCRVKGLNYPSCFDGCNEAVEGNLKNIQHGVVLENTIESKISAPQECVYGKNDKFSNDTTIKLRGDDTQSTSTIPIECTREEQLMACNLFEMKELEQVEQQLESVQHDNGKLVGETQITLVKDEPSTCVPMFFTIEEQEMAHEMIAIEEVEQTRQFKSVQDENESLVNETRMKLVDEQRKCAPTRLSLDEHQIWSDICNLKELKQSVQQLECVQHDIDNLVNETSSCTMSRFTIEEQQMESSIFDIKELEKTQQRLEKIVEATKSLQMGLDSHLHCHDSPIEKVHFSKVKVLQRSEAQEWLSDIAIERATNKILETCQGGRVRQFVQAFESIK